MKKQSRSYRITFRVDGQTNRVIQILASRLNISTSLFCRYAVMMMGEAYGFEQLGIDIPVAPEILCEIFHVDKDRELVGEAVKLIREKHHMGKHKDNATTIHEEIEEEFESLQKEGGQRMFEDDIKKRKI